MMTGYVWWNRQIELHLVCYLSCQRCFHDCKYRYIYFAAVDVAQTLKMILSE